MKYLTTVVQVIRDSLDGGNLTSVMSEFARRFYKVLLAHIYQFTYNSQGAMLLLCDINEYRFVYAISPAFLRFKLDFRPRLKKRINFELERLMWKD